MQTIKVLPILALFSVLGACASPEKTKEYAMSTKPLELCNEYNIAFETKDNMRLLIYKEAITARQINCQTYKNDLAILENQRFIKTLVGP